MTEQNDTFDVAVLGAGPGGLAAAGHAALRGARVALIERAHLGGVCLNVGCMPTKAMLHATDLAWRMRRAETLGVEPAAGRVDGAAMMTRVAEVVAELRARTESAATSQRNVELIRGRARLDGPDAVVVETDDGTRRIRAERTILASGSRPVRPDFLPWDSPRVMTTDEACTATDLPGSIAIIGGGVIGCEFACLFAEAGIPVTLIEMLEELLPPLDKDASKVVRGLLEARGVHVLTSARVRGAEVGDDAVDLTLDDGSAVRAERLLVAVGRTANIEEIGLETAGVETDQGVIAVDDACRTNVPNLYAIGDVAERRQYAHLADRMGVVAAENATGGEASDDRAVVPVGIYTHPEVAQVGLSQAEAKQRHGKVRVLRYAYRNSGTALVYEETEGQLKVTVDPQTGRIHGALWSGPHATDLIQEFALAMRNDLTLALLDATIHAHPTFQEAASVLARQWAVRRR